MTIFSRAGFGRALAGRGGLFAGAALASVVLLAGCAVEWKNREAAQELAQASKPPGSVYLGWRVFQDRCARCHGADATGTGSAPNLLPRVAQMGPRQFVGVVLTRYDWSLPPEQAGAKGATKEALVEGVMRGDQVPIAMPAWQGEPRVTAHIMDLYAYLSARADGRQGPDRPAQ